MTVLLLAGALALAQQDTVVPVSAGTRLQIENMMGKINVRTWDREAVRVSASHSRRARLRLYTSGSVLRVSSEGEQGPPGTVDYNLTVPARMPLEMRGPFTDVSVDGAQGDITVETVRGDVSIKGGAGVVALQSVEGEITLAGARGRIEVHGVNGGIRIEDTSGEIFVNGVNGDILLFGIQSARVEANTVNGEVRYDGTIREDGRYSLVSHNGDVVVGIPENASAVVTVATYQGEFEAAFPIRLTEARRSERFSFTLGAGGARVHLETFNGDIELRRPGTVRRDQE